MERADYYSKETEERKTRLEAAVRQVTGDDQPCAEYILACVENINEALGKKDYRKGFGLFLLCLTRLKDAERGVLIPYYESMLFDSSCGLWSIG